jgi:hypothetical protein
MGNHNPFYYPEDHKFHARLVQGYGSIIRERGLWPESPDAGLLTQCPNFKCPPGHMDCCCRHILFLQPDFIAQKSQLEELIESQATFATSTPNTTASSTFIEQYWGTAKSHYRDSPWAKTGREMEASVQESLDSVSLLQIRR